MIRDYAMNRWTVSLFVCFVSMVIQPLGVGQPSGARGDDFSDELPRIAVTEPSETIANFTVAEGFRIELVASEPLIGSPVAIEWGGDGRMYVCEMRGYSEDREDGISSIGLLEDTDRDGVYDRRTSYAEGLFWPTAIFPYDGGLFVGDAPDLLYLKDTDGDGIADTKKTVLTGFGTSNVQGLMNSFRWGLDNRIHIACSSVGGVIRNAADPDESKGVNIRGRDLALDPRTYDFQPISGAAQHGMCFDDWGRKFVSSNSDHIQQVMYDDRYISRNRYFSPPPARISIAADGPQAEVFRSSPVEPWRIVRTRLRVAGAVPGPIEGGGRAAGYFTGATGVTIYRGDAWPAPWKGLAIVGDVGSNLVHRKQLEPNGIEFIAKRIDRQSEFVSSSDIWFRPAQFANAPDGSLYVIDVCREVIEHPKSLPPDIKKHLDLTAGRDRGRIYRIVPDSFKHRATENLAAMSTGALVAMFEHPNAWHRETAARLLWERQDASAVMPLKRLARQSQSPLARMHALYALDGLSAIDVPTLNDRLSDPHPQVRRHSVKLCEQLPDPSMISMQLLALADDPSIEVRYQLAFTIGSLPAVDRAEVLARLIRHDVGDRWMAAAVQSSLAEDAGRVFGMLTRDSKFRSAAAVDFLSNLVGQISAANRRTDIDLALASLKSFPKQEAVFALPLIGEFLSGRGRKGSVLATMSASGELSQLDETVAGMMDSVTEIATDRTGNVWRRVEAIETMSFGAYATVGPALAAMIDNRQPHEVQRTAIITLGSFNEPHVAETLIDAWKGLSPQLRQTASEILFARPAWTLALFDAVDSGKLPISTIAPTRLQIAAQSKHQDVKTRASELLVSIKLGRREDVVARYKNVLDLDGDVERGRAIFVKQCSVCHKVEGVGHEIGPNLATIKTRGAETILVNVLDPNREVNPQYLNYIAITSDGRSISGMIAAENAASLTLRRAENAIDTVLRVDLDQLQSTGLSIMPEGMEETVDPQAMADVIAYLMQVQ